LLDSGTPSPNPWDLPLSRQNDWLKLKTLERRIGLRRDATRAPIPGPEWRGAGLQSRPQNSTLRPRRTLAYCGQKMVLTMGSTLVVELHLEIIINRHGPAVKRFCTYPERLIRKSVKLV